MIKATVIEAMVEEEGRRGEERRKEKKSEIRLYRLFRKRFVSASKEGKKKNKERNEMK